MYIYTYIQQIAKIMAQNISRPLYLHFILTSKVSEDMLCVFWYILWPV